MPAVAVRMAGIPVITRSLLPDVSNVGSGVLAAPLMSDFDKWHHAWRVAIVAAG
jgi:hypothetical protein